MKSSLISDGELQNIFDVTNDPKEHCVMGLLFTTFFFSIIKGDLKKRHQILILNDWGQKHFKMETLTRISIYSEYDAHVAT